MKIVIICLCVMLLIGCTSEPLRVHYYLLHTPENNATSASKHTKPVVVLQFLNVADYLRQPSLVMQVNQFELHYSHQDVWAEELQSSFSKALLQDLNTNGKRNYVASSSPEAKKAVTSINIKLEHFHATNAHTVVSSGQYWLSALAQQNENSENVTNSSHSFYFELELKQNGYGHAVKQLRTLVDNLAQQIKEDIAALPNN